MQVKELMSKNPATCTRDMSLQDVARLMREHDCGAIPVVESRNSGKPIGVVTDRDIAIKTVAEGKNPLELKAGDIMTTPCVTVSPDSTLDECCHTLEEHQIRRALVVDANGSCCGIVAQADIAMHGPRNKTSELVQEISQPGGGAA